MRICILVPITLREVSQLSTLFFIWSSLRRRREIKSTQKAGFDLSLCITLSGSSPELPIRDVQKRLRVFGMDDMFSNVEVTHIDIAASDDIYIDVAPEDNSFVMPDLGMKSGPNIQFFSSMRLLTDYDFVLLNETDAFPQRAGWEEKLFDACRDNRDKVIIGSRYKGKVNLSSDIRDHLNGNSIYNLAHPLFREGLLNQWELALRDACSFDPNTAYDILFARLRNDVKYNEIKAKYPLVANALYQTKDTPLICNASLAEDADPAEINRNIQEGAAILHGKHFKLPSLSNYLRNPEYTEKSNALQRSLLFQDLAPSERIEILTDAGLAQNLSNFPQSHANIAKKTEIASVEQEEYLSTSFFIKTYLPELTVAALAIASITLYCLSEHEIIVCTDNLEEISQLQRLIRDISPESATTSSLKYFCLDQIGIKKREGYIDQQVLKLVSHLYCKHPRVLHVDSDTVFWRQFSSRDFCIKGKLILPFSDWGRDEFLPNGIVRRLQIHSGIETHDIRLISDYLSSLDSDQLEEIGIKRFINANGASLATLLDGRELQWTQSYPDIAWKCSSRIWGTFAYDTMRSHYMIRSSSLKKCTEELEMRFSRSIWDIAYCRDIVPVLSEFQIIGNWILSCAKPEEAEYYAPTHWHQLFSRHKNKIPMIKYNLKTHPVQDYRRILDGEFSEIESKVEVIQKLQAPGWC